MVLERAARYRHLDFPRVFQPLSGFFLTPSQCPVVCLGPYKTNGPIRSQRQRVNARSMPEAEWSGALYKFLIRGLPLSYPLTGIGLRG